MNLSRNPFLDPGIEELIIGYNRTAAPLFTVISSIVLILILCDQDRRSRYYRRYLALLQVWSMASDVYMSVGSFITIPRLWIFYSNGYTPFVGRLSLALDTCYILMSFMASALISCILFRHQSILPKTSRWHLTQRNFFTLIAVCNLQFLLVLPFIHYVLSSSEVAENDVTSTNPWLTTRVAFIQYDIDGFAFLVAIIAAFVLVSPALAVTVGMLVQMFIELRRGMIHASSATRKYQIQTAHSIAAQATVPFICYALPFGAQLGRLAFSSMEPSSKQGATVSEGISTFLFTVVNLHAFLNSLIILSTTPPYRLMLLRPLYLVLRQCGVAAPLPIRPRASTSTSEERRASLYPQPLALSRASIADEMSPR